MKNKTSCKSCLSRHAEIITASHWYNNKTLKQVQGDVQGYTLMERLVVVLIIGILASIALPQYQKAVEKSRTVEVLQTVNALQRGLEFFILSNGFPSPIIYWEDMDTAVDVCGTWNRGWCTTRWFDYHEVSCHSHGCLLQVDRKPYEYSLEVIIRTDNTQLRNCYTQKTDLGAYICKSLQSQGWTYKDEEY